MRFLNVLRSEYRSGLSCELGTPPIRGDFRDVIVCIGASTGGTEALNVLLRSMPVDSPAIAIVQYMPAGFTADPVRLDAICQIEAILWLSGYASKR